LARVPRALRRQQRIERVWRYRAWQIIHAQTT
jgi:hypothetical protein